eukprot:CAMPEP_0170544298 /NCGR_PEP_ID=MMETSP0211-20121228/3116_1 /TAXON_ID=311385 /ORGANISM="Pseudokeronopsis sp., Strain OXSARD2" /LENGTH=137 /DNA_ID=CAMNT_0010847917 /DNA_START=968 /DNA_END=1378 /DNA_ORIENTATION=+
MKAMFQKYQLGTADNKLYAQKEMENFPDILIILVKRIRFNGINMNADQFKLGFGTDLSFRDFGVQNATYAIQSIIINDQFNNDFGAYSCLVFNDEKFLKNASDSFMFCERGSNPVEAQFQPELASIPWVLIYSKKGC